MHDYTVKASRVHGQSGRVRYVLGPNISKTVGDRLALHKPQMAYGKSNGHVTDDVT